MRGWSLAAALVLTASAAARALVLRTFRKPYVLTVRAGAR